MKRQRKKLDKGTEARRVARNSRLVPGATRVREDKRRKPPKHKLRNDDERLLGFETGPDRT
jgi:hypothetical protein